MQAKLEQCEGSRERIEERGNAERVEKRRESTCIDQRIEEEIEL